MSITPDFVGQIYKDTTTGNLWRANSLTAGDWTLELQNSQIKWLPTSVNLLEGSGIACESGIISPTDITFYQSTFTQDVLFSSTSITGLHFPNLISIDPDFWWGSSLKFDGCTVLSTLDLPLLQQLGSGTLSGQSCLALTSLNLPSLLTIAENITFSSSASLSTVSFPMYLPTNGKSILFNSCALTQASVDHILSRCVANPAFVSGTVDLFGGTNSTPSASGINDANTLTGRGVVVSTN